jgi:putative ATP-binding cassette transporter
MQAASAFTIVQTAFNWLVDNYPRLADWTASARRVSALMLSLDALEKAEGGQGVSRIDRNDDGETAALTLRELSITLDDGTAVVDEAEVAIKHGERVLIAGDSGTGKSTLIRAIAGLWPWGEGKIQVRKGAKLMFLPQRPYIPIGSLRRAATYPEAAESRTAEDVAEAFRRVGLEHLIPRLDEEASWDQTLSGGEKQRLAFARIVLQDPDIIVLDEATAAYDADQRRPPSRAGIVSYQKDRAGTPTRRDPPRQRYPSGRESSTGTDPQVVATLESRKSRRRRTSTRAKTRPLESPTLGAQIALASK